MGLLVGFLLNIVLTPSPPPPLRRGDRKVYILGPWFMTWKEWNKRPLYRGTVKERSIIYTHLNEYVRLHDFLDGIREMGFTPVLLYHGYAPHYYGQHDWLLPVERIDIKKETTDEWLERLGVKSN